MSHQEIPIAVAEIVGTTTDRGQNSYDRELEQRVVSVQSELQKKSAHLEGLNSEIRTLKASLVPLLGAAFIRRCSTDYPIISKFFIYSFIHSIHNLYILCSMQD